MSYYTKYRVYQIPNSKYADVSRALSTGCSFNVMDMGYRRPEPGKPVSGNIREKILSALYCPKFYWTPTQLFICIPDVVTQRNNPPYSQELGFWGWVEGAIKKNGGILLREGSGWPAEVPTNAP